MTAVPAYVVAAVDQHRAALRDLVRLAREHQRQGCELPGTCAGAEVGQLLERLGGDRAVTLAFTAIAELALLGYAQEPDDGLDEAGLGDGLGDPDWRDPDWDDLGGQDLD